MIRREFILLGSGAVAFPFATSAQPNTTTIGYFSGRSAETEGQYKEAFYRAFEEFGYREGRNVAVEYRFSEGRDAALPEFAADLVRHGVAVLVATAASA